MSTENGEAKPKLQDLLHDPESLPTDPEELAALIGGEDDGVDPADTGDTPKGDEPKGDAPKDAEPKGDAPDPKDAKTDHDHAPKGDGEVVVKPDGVLLKDGKTVIPYATLEATRRREDQERRAREEAESRVKELTAELEKARKGGEPDPQSEEKTSALKEKIKALAGEVPEVAELFEEVLGTVDTLTTQLREVQERDERMHERERESAAERVQQAIDANPVLRYWQNENAELYNEAVGYDRQIRENPKFAHLTLEQRFQRVVQVMENLYGTVELPEAYKPKDASKPAAPAPAKDDKAKDVKAGAEAKLEDKAITLSDLPGGASPKSDQKAMEEMTAGDIDAAVNRMLDKGMNIQDILASYR